MYRTCIWLVASGLALVTATSCNTRFEGEMHYASEKASHDEGLFYCDMDSCPGHRLSSDECAHSCDAKGCPGHASRSDRCAFFCERRGCPGHGSAEHRCY